MDQFYCHSRIPSALMMYPCFRCLERPWQVYRNYKVLVRHSVNMMSPAKQIVLLQTPIWALACFLLSPSVARMDYQLNR